MSIKFVSPRIAVGDSADGNNESLMAFNGIACSLNAANDLDMPAYGAVKGRFAGLIPGPGNTIQMIDDAVSIGKTLLRIHKKLLIYCHAGADRSPLVAAAVLSEIERFGFDRAWQIVKEKLGDQVKFESPEVEDILMNVFKSWHQQCGYGQKTVSIVMPCYKRPDITRRCLLSIRKNTEYRPYEIIAINDGSTDDTELNDILYQYCDIVIPHDENKGVAVSRADGNDVANGDIICHIDNDTVFFNNWLFPLIERIIKFQEVAIAAPMYACNIHYFSKLVDQMRPEGWYEVKEVGCACMVFLKELLEEIGNFDTNLYNLWEDKDFCYRITRNGKEEGSPMSKIIVDPRVTVYHDGYIDADTGDYTDIGHEENTRSMGELQKHDRIYNSMKIINDKWSIKHEMMEKYEKGEV